MKAVGKGNAKTFRGGGAYTAGRSFDNSAQWERDSHGNKPSETGLRNKRSVWEVATQPCKDAHFATFPPRLIVPCILAGSRPGDIVLDPFMGAGTTALLAKQLGRAAIGCELNDSYIEMAARRLGQRSLLSAPDFTEGAAEDVIAAIRSLPAPPVTRGTE